MMMARFRVSREPLGLPNVWRNEIKQHAVSIHRQIFIRQVGYCLNKDIVYIVIRYDVSRENLCNSTYHYILLLQVRKD